MTDEEGAFEEASKMLSELSIPARQGKYWFWVDGDGYWHPMTIEMVAEMLENMEDK